MQLLKKMWPLWIFAIAITLFTAYYQRITGPTHPQRVQATVAKATYTLSFPRTLRTEILPQQALGDWERLSNSTTLKIKVKSSDKTTSLPEDTPIQLRYKRARSLGDWSTVKASVRPDGHIEALLPSQPPAGKLAYSIILDGVALPEGAPIVVRFRNNVPAWALIPHIFFMFAAMLLSTLCGLLSLRTDNRWKKYAPLTVVILLVGGLILGPVVQKFAFGAYWTGWPLDDDLTDTKTLIAACFWILPLLFMRKRWGCRLAIAAAVALLVIFSIPHSTSGSEFNYETGVIGTEERRVQHDSVE